VLDEAPDLHSTEFGVFEVHIVLVSIFDKEAVQSKESQVVEVTQLDKLDAITSFLPLIRDLLEIVVFLVQGKEHYVFDVSIDAVLAAKFKNWHLKIVLVRVAKLLNQTDKLCPVLVQKLPRIIRLVVEFLNDCAQLVDNRLAAPALTSPTHHKCEIVHVCLQRSHLDPHLVVPFMHCELDEQLHSKLPILVQDWLQKPVRVFLLGRRVTHIVIRCIHCFLSLYQLVHRLLFLHVCLIFQIMHMRQ